jgi:putative flippase GtrA
MNTLLTQAWRFGGVGVAATALHVVVAFISNSLFGAGPYQANLLGFACASAVSYFGNFHLTFELSGNHRVHLLRFCVVSLVCLLLSNGLVALTGGLMHLPYFVTLATILIIVPPTSFALSKFWAFSA